MLSELISNKVYYKIFDKDYKDSSHIYNKLKHTDEAKLAEVENNIQSIKKYLAVDQLVVLNQIHGISVLDADQYLSSNFEPELGADASITTKSGIALAIQTADCVPVLLSSTDGKVIGAAHCGWRSAKSGIIEVLVEKMKQKGSVEFKALIGPAIKQDSYEVDSVYYEGFVADCADYSRFFIPSSNPNRYMFDLPGFVVLLLNQLGVNDVHDLGEDTYANPSKYPSYRRSFHGGESHKHNILSTILIR
jgi:hypothetical protein